MDVRDYPQIPADVMQKLWKIWDMGNKDETYHKMLMDIRILEDQYEDTLARLDETDEEVIRRFVALSEAMWWRMLQVACMFMDIIEI